MLRHTQQQTVFVLLFSVSFGKSNEPGVEGVTEILDELTTYASQPQQGKGLKMSLDAHGGCVAREIDEASVELTPRVIGIN